MSLSSNITSIEGEILRLDSYLATHLSPKRYRHTCGVADTAQQLAHRFGDDEQAARFAGLAHDLAREWDQERITTTALRDGGGLSETERNNPILLHGRAAAHFLESEWGFHDPTVLAAVRHHTLGSPNPSTLDLILFCADYLEPNRSLLDEQLRTLRDHLPLLPLTVAVIDHAEERGYEADDTTRRMRAAVVSRMETR